MIRIPHQKEPLKLLKWQGETNRSMLTLLSTHRKTFIAITKTRDDQNQPRDNYLQKTGPTFAAALFYGSLLVETRRQIAI